MVLRKLKKGKKVAFTDAETGITTKEKIVEIGVKYNYIKDFPYTVIELSGGREFDCDTGLSIESPFKNYIKVIT